MRVIIFDRMQQRRGAAADLAAVNEVLRDGEYCVESDTGFRKVGNGVSAWNDLPYMDASATPYQPSSGGLDADNVQDAIDELANEKIDDAPSDGSTYGRKNGAWANVAGGGGGGGAWSAIKKASNETRTATTTLADDTTLKFSATAGKKYVVRGKVSYSQADTTMDMKYGLAFSGTKSDIWFSRAFTPPGAAGTSAESQTVSATLFASEAILTAVAGVGTIRFEACFEATTSGDFSFQWAQNTSTAGNLTVLPGSYLEYSEL